MYGNKKIVDICSDRCYNYRKGKKRPERIEAYENFC